MAQGSPALVKGVRTVTGSIPGWESRVLVIPMTFSVTHWRHPDDVGEAAPRVQPLIQEALQAAQREGWQADEPTDSATHLAVRKYEPGTPSFAGELTLSRSS
jgi:hypothetical protein